MEIIPLEHGAYALAGFADCASPDALDSPGAGFLERVQSAVNDAAAYWDDWDEADDGVHEIADGAVPIYTHERWQVFTDLAAYQEESELGEWPDDLTDAAGWALYQVADRLARVLVDELRDQEPDEDEDEDEDEEVGR